MNLQAIEPAPSLELDITPPATYEDKKQQEQLHKHEQELSDLVIDHLDKLGVEYVFGIPGGAIEPLYNALARSQRQGKVRPLVTRHEAGAAFMADGYTRETGRLGVCCATTGPGTTNLLTGVASAYADNVPMLVITAQTALPNFGKGAFQESSYDAIDTVNMFENCTRYNTIVTHPHQLESKLNTAIMMAMREPRGPVHLSIPMDILRYPAPNTRTYPNLDHLLMQQYALVDSSILKRLYRAINEENQKVVILLGSGCREAVSVIFKFAEFIYAPVITTPQGKCWVDTSHPLYHGVFGFAGHDSARKLLLDDKVRLVLAVGTSLGEWSTNGWDRNTIMNEKLVHIDSSIERFARSPMANLQVYGRIRTIFETLYSWANEEQLAGLSCPWTTWNKAKAPRVEFLPQDKGEDSTNPPPQISLQDRDKYLADETVPLKPQRLLYELNRRLPKNTRFVADTGNSFAWTTHYLLHTMPGAYRVAMGFGSMGWGIGAAVGTALGMIREAREKDEPIPPVVCLTGDGSFLMNGQEITVAVTEKLPVIFAVLNDRGLGMVKHGQRLTNAEQVGFELPEVDFAMMARSVKAEAYTIKSLADLNALDFDEICQRDVPTLLDIHVDPEEPPPMGVRARALKNTKPTPAGYKL